MTMPDATTRSKALEGAANNVTTAFANDLYKCRVKDTACDEQLAKIKNQISALKTPATLTDAQLTESRVSTVVTTAAALGGFAIGFLITRSS